MLGVLILYNQTTSYGISLMNSSIKGMWQYYL